MGEPGKNLRIQVKGQSRGPLLNVKEKQSFLTVLLVYRDKNYGHLKGQDSGERGRTEMAQQYVNSSRYFPNSEGEGIKKPSRKLLKRVI